MKSKFRFYKCLLLVSALFAMLSFNAAEVQATHFRYGHLTWQKVSGNTARFTLTNAFRRDGYFGTAGDGFPAVGDIITETIGTTVLNFGDFEQTAVLQYRVKAIDVTNNWLLAVAMENAQLLPNKETIDHTYDSPTAPGGGPWIAEINSCCRTSVEQNNPDDDYQVSTLVELTSGNRSPVSSLPAIVNVAQSATSQFLVPGADADPNTVLTWRLATSDEAGNGFNQPAGLTIDPLTGLVTWNSLGAVLGGLYSCQVIIEDRDGSSTAPVKTRVAVDFLIYVTPQIFPCDVNVAPTFSIPPTPPNGNVFNVNEGQNVSFTISASDADAGNVVTLNSAGIPVGATLSTGLPADGNPISTNFSWTPIVGQAGAHVVTFSATDSCGLQALVSYTINVAPSPVACSLAVSISNTKTSCYGTCDGTLTANPSKGLAPYSYVWSNGQTTKTITGLCKGPYTVTVTDARGCSVTKSCAVNSPAQIRIACTAQTNVKCKGDCTGSLTVNATGGSGIGFQYLWSNGETTKTITGLCAGPYTVTVTDSKGCTAVFTKTITEPAKALAVTVSKTQCSVCLPNCNGTATANPTGGVSPYTYLWSNGQTTKKILYLCAGSYTVTVTDKNGCTKVCQTTIVGNCCVLSINPTINQNVNCSPCNGSISVAPTGGSGSYNYTWSNGSTASSITGLCAGSYTVTVTDNQSASCTATATYNVSDNIVTVNAYCSVINDESAPGANDGALDGSATGGTGSYSYAWSNGQTTEDISGLTAGIYTLVVLDANGCSATTNCSIITLEEQCDGDFTTYTQGGWGNTGAPGNYMAANFENCFGSVVIGDPCGFTITLTDSNEVREFLPQGSTAAALTQSYVDPGSANITVLAGQVLGVVFALGYDDCDPDFGGSPTDLGLQVYNKPGHPWNGWNIQQIADESNRILAGCASLYTPADANTACTDINENYDQGANNGLFYCPGIVRLADANAAGITTVYPNPFAESFTVKFNSDEEFTVTLTDLSGRLMGAYNGGMHEMEIGTSLQAGVYLVTLTTESGYKSVTRVFKGK